MFILLTSWTYNSFLQKKIKTDWIVNIPSSRKPIRTSRKKYGLSRKQSAAMRSALKKARSKGYKDYSPAMRKMISSAIHRAK